MKDEEAILPSSAEVVEETIESAAVVDIGENIRLVGTAHISRASAELVKRQIEIYHPERIAVELDESRLIALEDPQTFDEETLGVAIRNGRAPLLLFQAMLATQQRKMGLETGEMPGVDLLTAVEEAREREIPFALVDRDVRITLRRAWVKMGLIQRFRLLTALIAPEEEEEIDVDAIPEDLDLISSMMEELRQMIPAAGEVLIDERDCYLGERIRQESTKGRVLAVIGAGHLSGVEEVLRGDPAPNEHLKEIDSTPPPGAIRKAIPFVLPALMIGVMAFLLAKGDTQALLDSTLLWLGINAACAALCVLIVGGHPISILTAAIASPITSLNPTLAAGWFAGAAQLKFSAPRNKDLQEFLLLDSLRLLFTNRAGRVLLVTVMGNIGSSIGAWVAGPLILGTVI